MKTTSPSPFTPSHCTTRNQINEAAADFRTATQKSPASKDYDFQSYLLKRAEEVARQCAELAADSDAEGVFPVKEFELLGEAGLLAAPLNTNLGGAGLGHEPDTMRTLLQILIHIGRGNLAVGRIYEGHANALQLIAHYANGEQLERYARDVHGLNPTVARLELNENKVDDFSHVHQPKLFGVWNTQAADGVSLHLTKQGKITMRGAKTFATGAQHVQRPIVTGALFDETGNRLGWQMCVVPMERVAASDIDASWWKPLGMRATASYKINFTGVELDENDLLGAPENYYLQPLFSGGAIRFAAVQLGGAEALFNHTRDYLQTQNRTQDAHQIMRAGEAAIKIESGNLWLQAAARAAEQCMMRRPNTTQSGALKATPEIPRMLAYADMTRTAIEEICLDVMRLAERSIGARGLLRPHPMERIHRDLTLYLRQPATDAALAGAGRYVLECAQAAHELWSFN